MASARTANEIISDALKLLGNETLTADAQVWLNNFLDRLYEDYRWPFQEESASGGLSSGDSSVNLPADFVDFWDRNGLRLEDENGNFSRLRPEPSDSFDMLVDPDLAGHPELAYVDFGAMTWTPYPVPNQAYTWHLRYKRKPTRITNFDLVITFPNDMLLTQAVFVRGLQQEDDDRYVKEFAVLDDMIKRYRRGWNVSPTKGTRLERQRQTFRGIAALR